MNATQVIEAASTWLRAQPGSPKILLKIAKNLGDTLHGCPIIKHYRTLYPQAAIAMVVCQQYYGAHEFNSDLTPGGLFSLPNAITEQDRLKLWPAIMGQPGIDIKLIPAINPFQALYPQNKFSYPCIADQYFANAKISDCKPAGGRRFIVNITDDDRAWAQRFFDSNSLDPNKCVVFEYNSYSHPVAWVAKTWSRFMRIMPEYRFIGIAGSKEGLIPGMIDGRGISWRQTVALLNRVPKAITVGSGIGMLSAGAEHQPHLYEIGVPESVTISRCGYAITDVILNPTPESVRERMIK